MGSVLKIKINYGFYKGSSQGEIVRMMDLLELKVMKKIEHVRELTKQRSN